MIISIAYTVKLSYMEVPWPTFINLLPLYNEFVIILSLLITIFLYTCFLQDNYHIWLLRH